MGKNVVPMAGLEASIEPSKSSLSSWTLPSADIVSASRPAANDAALLVKNTDKPVEQTAKFTFGERDIVVVVRGAIVDDDEGTHKELDFKLLGNLSPVDNRVAANSSTTNIVGSIIIY